MSFSSSLRRSWLVPCAMLAVVLACAAPSEEAIREAEPQAAEASAPQVDSGEYSADGFHKRPIVEHDGRTLLWAKEHDDGDQEWFDVTAAMIDPQRFQFGIGKDTIPSIDEPVFCEFDDPRLEAAGVDLDTPVLGVAFGGEARAYPVDAMSRHEVVNDELGGQPYAVLW